MKFILKFQGENKKLTTIINMKKNSTFQVRRTFTNMNSDNYMDFHEEKYIFML